jgi:hypothetical protein
MSNLNEIMKILKRFFERPSHWPWRSFAPDTEVLLYTSIISTDVTVIHPPIYRAVEIFSEYKS